MTALNAPARGLWCNFAHRSYKFFMKGFLTLVLSVCLFCTASAQSITANDSVNTGSGFWQMVFYSLSTGYKTVTSNTDWHLAITTRPTQFPSAPLGGTTIRFNEAGGMTVYIAPNATGADYTQLDTTGWRTWRKLHDSDTMVDLGAFNSNRNTGNIYDFGWGKYNSVTHNVNGDSVYLIQLPNGDLKKFFVNALVWDTAFDIKYANIDNTDSQHVYIRKHQYIGKEFVYLNMLNNTVEDKEPNSSDWDIQFIKYTGSDVTAGQFVPKTGAWMNKGTTAAKDAGANLQSTFYYGLDFTSRLNGIGWNWQLYDSAGIFYGLRDSLIYFVQKTNGDVYKIIFTGFDQQTGEIAFYSQFVGGSTAAIAQVAYEGNIMLFPNPTQNELNVSTGNNEPYDLKVFDLNGNLVLQRQESTGLSRINTTSLANGLYVINFVTPRCTQSRRFAVVR